MNLIFIIIISVIVKMGASETMPVLLIDYQLVFKENISNNPFHVTNGDSFREIVKSAAKSGDIVIIFVEDTFSREDVSRKDEHGTAYMNLRQGFLEGKVKYFPSVEDPYENIINILLPQAFNEFFITSADYKPQSFYNRLKYCYIYFKDQLEEPRTAILKKHDTLMKIIYDMVAAQTGKPVIAFYTGKNNLNNYNKSGYLNCYNKCVREDESRLNLDPGVFVKAPRSLFFFKGLRKSGDLRRKFRRFPIVDKEVKFMNKMKTFMRYADLELTFDFVYDPWQWTLESISWITNNTTVGRAYMDVHAKWGNSYVCGEPIVIRNRKNNDVLRINQYQFQLLRDDEEHPTDEKPPASEDKVTPGGETVPPTPSPAKEDKPSDFLFGEPEKCTGYISIGILTCLLLSLMCIYVFCKASQYLMMVQGNDKYDDPKRVRFFGEDEG